MLSQLPKTWPVKVSDICNKCSTVYRTHFFMAVDLTEDLLGVSVVLGHAEAITWPIPSIISCFCSWNIRSPQLIQMKSRGNLKIPAVKSVRKELRRIITCRYYLVSLK